MVQLTPLQQFLLLASSYWFNNQCPLTFDYLYPHNQLWELENVNFDFIIVGGGTAGSVLANRLSEISQWNILLIEAGGLPPNISEVPALFLSVLNTNADWAFTSEPTAYACRGLIDQRCGWSQGRVLGGSSAINGMHFSQAVPWDFDNWNNLGNPGWNHESVQPYFTRLNAFLSAQGYVKSTFYQSSAPTRNMLINACNELGIPVNTQQVIGYRDFNVTIHNGQRFSMAKAYLHPIRDRPNLRVLLNTRVTRILIENQQAVGVRIATEIGNVDIRSRREIIVTAGGINSPKLLMLSGIGPASHLNNLGIQVVRNLPVGNNLQDHVSALTFLTLPPNYSFTVNSTQAFNNYCANRTDLNDTNTGNFQGYYNTNPNITDHPNVEFYHVTLGQNDQTFVPAYLNELRMSPEAAQSVRKANQNASMLVILTIMLHPVSTGYVRLRDANPFSDPMIYPDFYTQPEDMTVMMQALAFLRNRMFRTAAFRGTAMVNLTTPNCNNFIYNTTPYWMCYINNYSTLTYHNAMTCRMGPNNANSVVDSRFRVHGILNLRVADSSTMPALVSGHPNIVVCMMAERASDFIKEDNGAMSDNNFT